MGDKLKKRYRRAERLLDAAAKQLERSLAGWRQGAAPEERAENRERLNGYVRRALEEMTWIFQTPGADEYAKKWLWHKLKQLEGLLARGAAEEAAWERGERERAGVQADVQQKNPGGRPGEEAEGGEEGPGLERAGACDEGASGGGAERGVSGDGRGGGHGDTHGGAEVHPAE